MHLDPRIGILQQGHSVVYYAFVNGYHAPETQGTLEQVEAALGLRKPGVKAPKRTRKDRLKTYEVTVTPAGGYTGPAQYGYAPYTVEISANTKLEAMTQARRAYRDEEGRYAPKPITTATRIR